MYVNYISKRFCCYNIVHLFKIVEDLTEMFTGKIYFGKKNLKSNLKFVLSHFQANKKIKS